MPVGIGVVAMHLERNAKGVARGFQLSPLGVQAADLRPSLDVVPCRLNRDIIALECAVEPLETIEGLGELIIRLGIVRASHQRHAKSFDRLLAMVYVQQSATFLEPFLRWPLLASLIGLDTQTNDIR